MKGTLDILVKSAPFQYMIHVYFYCSYLGPESYRGFDWYNNKYVTA